jgi:hypothetical protein
MCGANLHQLISAAVLAGSSGLGIALGWAKQFRGKENDKKK